MSEGQASYSPSAHTLVYMAAFVIVIAGVREAAAIVVPLMLAAFIAIICARPMLYLKEKGLPLPLALLVVVIGVIGIGLLIGVLLGTSIDDFSRSVPFYQEQIKNKSDGLLHWLSDMGIEVMQKNLRDAFNPGAAMNLVARMLKGVGGVLTNSFLIMLTVIFMLLEASGFSAKVRGVLSDPERSGGNLERFVADVQRYMAIKTVISLVTGVCIGAWLWVLGVDYALLWGLLAFLLNYVPNIGSIIAAFPAVILALIQFGVGKALLTALGFLAVNVAMGNVVEPRVMGRGMGLSPLVVFLSLVFWGWVFGPVGMLLSVPLTMTLKIALESTEDMRWIAVLLGPGITEQAEAPVKEE